MRLFSKILIISVKIFEYLLRIRKAYLPMWCINQIKIFTKTRCICYVHTYIINYHAEFDVY